MKPPIWKPEVLDDLSGGWLAWHSPVGRMIVERRDNRYVASWCLENCTADDDVELPPCPSVHEAQAAAVAWVVQEAKRRLKDADKLRKAMAA